VQENRNPFRFQSCKTPILTRILTLRWNKEALTLLTVGNSTRTLSEFVTVDGIETLVDVRRF
jgi:hypothetical protein